MNCAPSRPLLHAFSLKPSTSENYGKANTINHLQPLYFGSHPLGALKAEALGLRGASARRLLHLAQDRVAPLGGCTGAVWSGTLVGWFNRSATRPVLQVLEGNQHHPFLVEIGKQICSQGGSIITLWVLLANTPLLGPAVMPPCSLLFRGRPQIGHSGFKVCQSLLPRTAQAMN